MNWKLTLKMVLNICWVLMGIFVWVGIAFPFYTIMTGLGCVGLGVLMALRDIEEHYEWEL